MAGNTAQRILSAVEQETLLCVNNNGTNTIVCGNGICAGTIIIKICFHLIEIRIFKTIPEMRLINDEFSFCLTILNSNLLCFIVCRKDNLTALYNFCRNPDDCLVTIDFRSNCDARCAVIQNCEVRMIQTQQIDITIDAAVESKVSRLRINAVVGTVVDSDAQQIFILQIWGQIITEGREAAVMMTDLCTIEIDVSTIGCAFKFNDTFIWNTF